MKTIESSNVRARVLWLSRALSIVQIGLELTELTSSTPKRKIDGVCWGQAWRSAVAPTASTATSTAATTATLERSDYVIVGDASEVRIDALLLFGVARRLDQAAPTLERSARSRCPTVPLLCSVAGIVAAVALLPFLQLPSP